MDLLKSLFQSGAIIDLILVLMVVEVIALIVWRHFVGTGPGILTLLPFLAAGVCLMLAVKFALTDQEWIYIAMALSGAFVFHLTDVVFRWQGNAQGSDRRKSSRHGFHEPERLR